MLKVQGSLKLSVIGVILLALTGCDPVYGVTGGKIIPGPADDECILAAIKQTPGVKRVWAHSAKNESTLLLGDGPVDDSIIRYFTYDIGEKYSPTLEIEEYSDDRIHYSNSMLSMHIEIPQDVIDRATVVMKSVNQRISQLCGADLSGIRERPF